MNYIEFVTNKFDRMKELFIKKNEQYSTNDPLANFRTAALMHRGEDSYAAMYEEAKNFMRKHLAHIENNGIGGHKVAESLDNVMVYANIMMYMIAAEAKEKSEKRRCSGGVESQYGQG